jgi:hypothetical protein
MSNVPDLISDLKQMQRDLELLGREEAPGRTGLKAKTIA